MLFVNNKELTLTQTKQF